MDIGAIASASIDYNLGKVQQAVGISLLKDAMDLQSSLAVDLLQSMPSFGHQLDVKI